MHGSIPPGMVIMHTCDNRLCVRPDHLRLGTQAENIQDMWSKGRAFAPPVSKRQETCREGHGDWYTTPAGQRCCRVCRRKRVSAWEKKKRRAKADVP